MSSRNAIDHGIRSEMPLAEAQALLESATFLPHDPEADLLELQSLAFLSHRYAPIVGLELSNDQHCLVLDITGCGHLFGDEFGLARQLVAGLSEAGYFAHIAVANTIGAAWGIARYGHGTASDRRLRSLPVEALRIPDKLVSSLQEFDLRTIRQLKALSRESLPSRFGTALTERLDQMFGDSEELLVPVSRPKPISAEWVTEDPICHPAAIRYVCEDLLSEILSNIRTRGEGLLHLTLNLKSEACAPTVLEVRLAQPTDSHRHVMTLLNLKLETTPTPEWLISLHMEASITALLRVQQRNLFDDDQSTDEGDIQRLTDRLSARLGQDAVVRPMLLPEATPERAVRYEPLADFSAKLPAAELAVDLIRPLDLLPQPEPVDVISDTSGSPVKFFWNRQSYRVVNATKPERIATDWWQDDGSICRDYYQVETQNGSRFWLYRSKTDDWFLHGVFE